MVLSTLSGFGRFLGIRCYLLPDFTGL